MTAADLIKVCLELDRQWLTSRPSPWGEAAELVAWLCGRAGAFHPVDRLGDWRSIDLSPARAKHVTGDLDQPTLGLAEEVGRLRTELEITKQRLAGRIDASNRDGREVEHLRGLVARLIVHEPHEWLKREDIESAPSCYFCARLLPDVESRLDPANHQPDCAWVEARKLVGGGRAGG